VRSNTMGFSPSGIDVRQAARNAVNAIGQTANASIKKIGSKDALRTIRNVADGSTRALTVGWSAFYGAQGIKDAFDATLAHIDLADPTRTMTAALTVGFPFIMLQSQAWSLGKAVFHWVKDGFEGTPPDRAQEHRRNRIKAATRRLAELGQQTPSPWVE